MVYEAIPQHNHYPPDIRTVHKFGGTSVAGPDQYMRVASIVERLVEGNKERPVIVVSAMAGITNMLYDVINAACTVGDYAAVLMRIQDHHVSCIKALGVHDILSSIETDITYLTRLIDTEIVQKGLSVCPGTVSDIIAGYGEVWSSKILASLIRQRGVVKSCAINARGFLFLSPLSGKDVRIDFQRSVAPYVEDFTVPIITGFLATSHSGVPTTLKRNGSDFSGAIIANLFDATELTIWTDVDGIFSADPRSVPSAQMLSSMSYKEAAELAYFGAKVIHPQTMAPCVIKSIPIILRNTFNLECVGTLISRHSVLEARAVTIIPQIALVNVEGSGLFGFSGIAAKLFSAVASADVNIIMITQASSEYSICFAVPFSDADIVGEAVRQIFVTEIVDKSIDVTVDTSACIIAAVGDNMHKQIGLLGRLTSALGQAGVNIRAIAQGSSERNITIVINRSDGQNGLCCLHDAL